MIQYDKLIFELSKKGRKAYCLSDLDIEDSKVEDKIDSKYLRKSKLEFPELSELQVVRHFTNISSKNYSIDSGFYPLGSCTMKYNPKLNEYVSSFDGFSKIHPLQRQETVQGALRLMYELDQSLSEITGMDKMCLNPSAGAHGEFSGIAVIKSYHEKRKEFKRDKIIVPDSAHGTNPATASMSGCKILEVKSDENGFVDVDSLKELVGDDTCALMLTNPNTLGLFDKNIKEITDIVHKAGGLCYYDGANANAILGQVKPGAMGFDVIHLNLHKSFSTPHGGGGPGAGPIGVKSFLKEFLPKPIVEKENQKYYLRTDMDDSIGRIKDFHGNFLVLVRAYAYILSLGYDGLKEVSNVAVLNANYIQASLESDYNRVSPSLCMHECLFAGLKDDNKTVTTLDVAKRLIDFGIHPPTIYFPLIVNQALMIEPTETESKETLDEFIYAMKQIAKEAKENPELLHNSPISTPVRRPDETLAARKPILKFKKDN